LFPPNFAFSQFTTNVRLPAWHTASTIIIRTLKSLLITPLRCHSPVAPVFSAFYFFVVVVVFIVMQHSAIPRSGRIEFTPTSAHPQTLVVKESSIEDFYQRLDLKNIKEIQRAADHAGCPERWVEFPVILVFYRINSCGFKTIIQYHIVTTGFKPDDGKSMITDTLDFNNLPCTFYPGFSTLL
jgi:hypothetical protein